MSTLLHRRYTIHQQQSRPRQQQQQQQQHGRYTSNDNPFAPSPPLHPVSCLKKTRPQSSGSTNPFLNSSTSHDDMLALSSTTLSRGGSKYHSRPSMMAADPESRHAYMYESSVYGSSGGHGRNHDRQRSAEAEPRWGDGPGSTNNHNNGYDRSSDVWDRHGQCMAPPEGRQRSRHDLGQDDDTEEDILDPGAATAAMRLDGESGSSDDSQTVNQERSRRISIDHLFKTPFGWNRRRRATCAAIDVKGELKPSPAAPLQPRTSRPVSMQVYSKPSIDDAIDYYSQQHRHTTLDSKRTVRMNGGEEILKSSRYNPDDDNAAGVGGHDEDTRLHEQHDYRGRGEPEAVMSILKDHGQGVRREREGQYGNADSPRQQQRSLVQHTQSPEQSMQRLRQRETSIESVVDPLRPRRRHSELSDWPADTSPRQRGMVLNNHRRPPPNDDRPEQLTGSGSSLTRSAADPVLEQQQHGQNGAHRRHSSMQHPYPPPSPPLDRAQDTYQRPPALPQSTPRPSHTRANPSTAIMYGGSHSGGVAFPLPPPLDSHSYHPHHPPAPPHGSTRYRPNDGPTTAPLSPWKRAPRWNVGEDAPNDRYERNQDPYSHDPDIGPISGYSGSKHTLREDTYHHSHHHHHHNYGTSPHPQDSNESWRRHGPTGHGQGFSGHTPPTTANGPAPLLSELSQRSLPRRSSQSYAQDFMKAGSGTGMSSLGSSNMGTTGVGLGMGNDRVGVRAPRPPWTHKGHTDSAYSFSTMSQSSAGGACAPPPSSIPSTPVSGYTFDQESQLGNGRDARDDTSRSSVCSERSGMVSESSSRLKRHARGGRDSTSLSSRRTVSTFRSMKEVHMRPYGQEDEDEEDEDDLEEEEEEEDEEDGERLHSQDSQNKDEDEGDHSPEDDEEEEEDNLDALVRHMEKSLRAFGSNPALDEEAGSASHGSTSCNRGYFDHHQPDEGLYRASSQELLVRGLHRNNSFCYGQSNPLQGGSRRGVGGDEDLDRNDRDSQGSSELKLSGTRARGRSLRRATTKIYRALQGTKQKKRQDKKERDLLQQPPPLLLQDPTGSREKTQDRQIGAGGDCISDTYHLNYESQDLRAGSRDQFLDQDMRYLQQIQRHRPVNDSGSHAGSGRYDERDPGVMVTSVTDLQHQQRQQLLYYQGQSEEEIDIDLRDEKHVRFASSSFSISSSLKSARIKLRRTKTVIQKVKRRLSTVAKGMISDSKSRPRHGQDEEEDQEKGDGSSQAALDQEGVKNSTSGGSLTNAHVTSQAASDQKPMSRLQRWASRRNKKKEKGPSGSKESQPVINGSAGGGGKNGGDNCTNDSLDVMQQEYYRRYRQEQLQQGQLGQHLPPPSLLQPQQPPQRYMAYSSYQGYHDGDEGRSMGIRGRRGAEFFYEDEDGEGREMEHDLGIDEHGRLPPRQYSRQYAQQGYFEPDEPFRHGHEGLDMMGMTAGANGSYGSHSNVHVQMQGAQDVRRYTLTDRATPY